MKFLYHSSFWKPASYTIVGCFIFFSWELGFLSFLPALPRPEVTQMEVFFAIAVTLLLSINAGLLRYRRQYGGCPIGAKRATGIGGAIGAIALICPVCVLLPAGMFGAGISLSVLAAYIPLLRIITLIVLGASTLMLWPKH